MGQLDALQILIGAVIGATCTWVLMARRPKQMSSIPEQTKAGKRIVVDGTNVLYWDGDGAQLATLRIVMRYLTGKGFTPIVFFDASTRHHLKDPSLDAAGFAKALSLPKNQVTVCPAKTQADAFILAYAREHRLPVLSNDQFRDQKAKVKGIKRVTGVIITGRPILNGL